MFTLGVFGLVVAYILIAVLLLSINLYSNWSWQVKASAIVITTLFYIITFISFPPLMGWPTRGIPPQNSLLIAAHVEQPDKITGTKGMIYLWLSQTDDLNTTHPPRAYEFDYSDILHEKIIKANSQLNKGIPQLVEFEKPNEGVIAKVKQMNRMGQESIDINFYDQPDRLFPEK